MRVPTIVLIENNFTNSTSVFTLHKERTEPHEAFQYIEIVCNGNLKKNKKLIIIKKKLFFFIS
jgi:hypothetical protein